MVQNKKDLSGILLSASIALTSCGIAKEITTNLALEEKYAQCIMTDSDTNKNGVVTGQEFAKHYAKIIGTPFDDTIDPSLPLKITTHGWPENYAALEDNANLVVLNIAHARYLANAGSSCRGRL